MKKEITIKDIAKQAGVSIATVSKVINNQGRIGEETRKKIGKIIEENHYSPNRIAVSMIKKTSNMIVVMVPDIFTKFYAEIIQGAENTCKARGYSVLVYATNAELKEEYSFFDNPFIKSADGILCIPSFNDAALYQRYKKPLVLVDRYIDNCLIDGIRVDNFGGAYQLTNHLIKRGHNRVAFVSGPLTMNVGRDRLNGYRQAMMDAKLDPDRDLYLKDWYEQDGVQAMQEIAAKGWEGSIGIVTGNSNICIGVLSALQEMGLELQSMPEIVCFDDCEIARYAKITVLNRSNIEMGEMAAGMLLDKIEKINPCPVPQVITIPLRLVTREKKTDETKN